jgi:type II secretory pathway predicted ATPase ExeA
VQLAYQWSRGIPRLINHYCDRALIYGYADRVHRIDADLMMQAIENRFGNAVAAN